MRLCVIAEARRISAEIQAVHSAAAHLGKSVGDFILGVVLKRPRTPLEADHSGEQLKRARGKEAAALAAQMARAKNSAVVPPAGQPFYSVPPDILEFACQVNRQKLRQASKRRDGAKGRYHHQPSMRA